MQLEFTIAHVLSALLERLEILLKLDISTSTLAGNYVVCVINNFLVICLDWWLTSTHTKDCPWGLTDQLKGRWSWLYGDKIHTDLTVPFLKCAWSSDQPGFLFWVTRSSLDGRHLQGCTTCSLRHKLLTCLGLHISKPKAGICGIDEDNTHKLCTKK